MINFKRGITWQEESSELEQWQRTVVIKNINHSFLNDFPLRPFHANETEYTKAFFISLIAPRLRLVGAFIEETTVNVGERCIEDLPMSVWSRVKKSNLLANSIPTKLAARSRSLRRQSASGAERASFPITLYVPVTPQSILCDVTARCRTVDRLDNLSCRNLIPGLKRIIYDRAIITTCGSLADLSRARRPPARPPRWRFLVYFRRLKIDERSHT